MLAIHSMDMEVQAGIWRGLAQQAVVAAGKLNDPELRLSMLSIAASYEAMARHAEAIAAANRDAELGVRSQP